MEKYEKISQSEIKQLMKQKTQTSKIFGFKMYNHMLLKQHKDKKKKAKLKKIFKVITKQNFIINNKLQKGSSEDTIWDNYQKPTWVYHFPAVENQR